MDPSVTMKEFGHYSYRVKKKLKGIFGKANGEVPEVSRLCLPVFRNISLGFPEDKNLADNDRDSPKDILFVAQ